MPIVVVVRLVPVDGDRIYDRGRTYSDNVSPRGLRVISRRAWQPGEEAEVTLVNEVLPVRGKVVYCEKFADGRNVVGIKFEGTRLPWRILERFDGL